MQKSDAQAVHKPCELLFPISHYGTIRHHEEGLEPMRKRRSLEVKYSIARE